MAVRTTIVESAGKNDCGSCWSLGLYHRCFSRWFPLLVLARDEELLIAARTIAATMIGLFGFPLGEATSNGEDANPRPDPNFGSCNWSLDPG